MKILVTSHSISDKPIDYRITSIDYPMRKLLIATHNKGKLREIIKLLYGIPFEITTLDDVGITHGVEETGTTFEDNAILKAKEYAHISGLLTLADDAGIEVDALGGRPGVYSDRYAENAKDRNKKLLGELSDVPDDKRTARYKTIIALYDPDNDKTYTTEGLCEGLITHKPKGNKGFDYDAIMLCPEFNKTMAELTMDEKNGISHRGKALTKMRDILLRA